ncbi:MAG TPA: FUSC family protein [Edaphocola sp.]|nr:FUSC family protein [Edaphocola sp.]
MFKQKYNQFRERISKEIIEPAWGWGFRVAMGIILPIMLSMLTGDLHYFWMIIGAETVSLIDLKGTAGMRTRLLLAALIFSILFTWIGGLVASSMFWTIILIIPVAFACGLMKNLGDWGLAMALNIYLSYLISSNYPAEDWASLNIRAGFTALGGVWAIIIGIFSFSFLPQGQPYRRTIGQIWLALEQLTRLVANNWDKNEKHSSIRTIYLKEQEIRKALDNSLVQFTSNFQDKNKSHKLEYARKCAALASLQIINISEHSNNLLQKIPGITFKEKMTAVLRVMEQIANRMGLFLYTDHKEEILILKTRFERLEQLEKQIKELPESIEKETTSILIHINRFKILSKLSLETLSENIKKDKATYYQYSFIQLLNILHPKYLFYNIKQFLRFDSLTFKYALRMALAAGVSYWVGFISMAHHSYWMPMTTIIVTQPFFGATLKKGIQRSIGTIGGVLAGALILMLPFTEITKYLLILGGAVLMIYNLKKNYSWAAFFITFFLIGLVALRDDFSLGMVQERLLATFAGGAISIAFAFFFFPTWDKKLLPEYILQAISDNYFFFLKIFYTTETLDNAKAWIYYKMKAETANSNAYDSLNRYNSEPKFNKEDKAGFYFTMITYNIRITRELNFFQDDQEADEQTNRSAVTNLIPKINNLHNHFMEVVQLMEQQNSIKSAIDWKLPKNINSNLKFSELQVQHLHRMSIEIEGLALLLKENNIPLKPSDTKVFS